jgi:hypothetical protein
VWKSFKLRGIPTTPTVCQCIAIAATEFHSISATVFSGALNTATVRLRSLKYNGSHWPLSFRYIIVLWNLEFNLKLRMSVNIGPTNSRKIRCNILMFGKFFSSGIYFCHRNSMKCGGICWILMARSTLTASGIQLNTLIVNGSRRILNLDGSKYVDRQQHTTEYSNR